MLFIKRAMLFFPFKFVSSTRVNLLKKVPISFGNSISCPSVTYNKKNLTNFAFDEKYKFVLDWHGWYKMACMPGSFNYCNQILVYHRIHKESETTKSIQENFRLDEEFEMFKLIFNTNIANILIKLYKFGHKLNKV